MNTENNKIIAEFMGVNDKVLSTGNIYSWSDAPFYYTTEDTKAKVINNIAKYSKYHSDWNWLIEVVEKIESLKFSVLIGKNTCVIEQTFGKISLNLGVMRGKDKIEAVYSACVEFIKWYNENKV